MAVKKVITETDLHSRDFAIVQENGKAKVALKKPLDEQIQVFNLTAGSTVRFTTASKNFVRTKNGVAILHLDFTPSRVAQNMLVATLPNNAPAPSYLLEILANDNSGLVFLSNGSRHIAGANLVANKRYIMEITYLF